MVGRAGRAGFGETGDSIMICAARDNTRVMSLLCSSMELVSSYMHEDNARALRALFLSAVGLGLATCRKELQQLAAATLFNVQAQRLDIDIVQISKDVIKDLIITKVLTAKITHRSNESLKIENVDMQSQDGSFTRPNSQNTQPTAGITSNKVITHVVLRPSTPLEVSRLGRASFKSGIDLNRSEAVYKELLQARMSLVVVDYLHLLYLITPYDGNDNGLIRPDMGVFYQKVCVCAPFRLN